MKMLRIFVSTMAFGAFVLTSCGDKKDSKAGDGGGDKEKEQASAPEPIIGKWIIRETDGVKSVSDRNWYQFMDDGKAVASTIGETSAATWKLVGDALTVTALADPNDPDDFDFPLTYVLKSIENGRMVLTLGGGVVLLERQAEDKPAGGGDKKNGGDGGEKAAIAAFTKEFEDRGIIAAVSEMEELSTNAEEEPIAMFDAMDALNEKLKPLNTEGLPADFKVAADSMKSQMNDLVAHVKAIPFPMDVLKGGEAAIAAWVGEKVAADPEFLTKFQEDMAGWETKMEALGTKMEQSGDEIGAVFEKYGIEGLND